MALKDVQNSLGFLALQAEAEDEKRRQAEAFAREQQAAESSATGFDRMTQLLSTLDARRQAKHDRDMEIAQLAGKAGVPLGDEVGNEAEGRFAIGEALSAAELRKQKEQEEARLSMQALINQRWGDREANRTDIEGERSRSRAEIEGLRQAGRLSLEDERAAHAEELAKLRGEEARKTKGTKPGKAGGAKGAGSDSDLPPGYQLTETDITRIHKAQEADGLQYNQFKRVSDSFTDEDFQRVGSLKESLSRNWNSFIERVFGGNALSDDEMKEMHRGDQAVAKLVRTFNILGKERSGAAFTSNEVKRLAMELPTVADSPTRLRAKLVEIQQAIRSDMLYRDKLIDSGRIPDVKQQFAEEDRQARLKSTTPEQAAQELARRREAANGGP